MDRKNIATRYQQPTENLLMDIATLAKKTPNLIDLSIGDPDLITDERIIEQAANDAKMGIQNIPLLMVARHSLRRSFSFISHIINYLFNRIKSGHSWRSARNVPCLTSDSKSWR